MANTKLLLIEDVEDLGRSGDVVTVRPGYARNFLLPQKVAVVADARTLRMQSRLQEERIKRAQNDKTESDELAAKLQGLQIETIVKVDHEGHMYGSVSALDIVHLIQAQGFSIEKRNIVLKHPIKEVGVTEISLKLKEGVESSITLKVVPEEVKAL